MITIANASGGVSEDLYPNSNCYCVFDVGSEVQFVAIGGSF